MAVVFMALVSAAAARRAVMQQSFPRDVHTNMRTAIIAIPLLLATGSALAGPFECGNTAPRRGAVSAAGATRIVVIGRAGTLKVKGEPGQAQVLANGTACTSDE